MRWQALVLGLLLPALGSTAEAREGAATTARPISRQHRLAPGVRIESGSVAFFSDLHIAYGKLNRRASPGARKNMVAIADLLRTTDAVSGVVFTGDYYHAPGMKGLSPKQHAARVVRGLAGLKERLGQKPLHVLFGNHDVPLLKPGDAGGYQPRQAMAASLERKQVGVIGTVWDRSYKFGLPDGALVNLGHAPKASSKTIAAVMKDMSFSADEHTERAREKMSAPPRRRQGEHVYADSHVVAFDAKAGSHGKATVVNLGTAGSESRPVGDPFTVAIRQPTRGWLFLKLTAGGFVPYSPRGSEAN